MQVGEALNVPVPHNAGEDKDCPFCPVEKGKALKTYPGKKNNSGKLEDIMEEPASLLTKQPNAWPHDGKKHPSRADVEAEHEHPDYGYYEFQAHHLVSGKQALQDHNAEEWIDKSKGLIEEDTGYTINGSLNGIWAPSWPKSFRTGAFEGQWTNDDTNRQEIANRVMKATGIQFHLGGHSIGDPLDLGKVKHMKYDSWLKNELTIIDIRMFGWADVCPLCQDGDKRKEKPFQPNEKINKALNKLSGTAKREISKPKAQWRIFLSRLALLYRGQNVTPVVPGKAIKRF